MQQDTRDMWQLRSVSTKASCTRPSSTIRSTLYNRQTCKMNVLARIHRLLLFLLARLQEEGDRLLVLTYIFLSFDHLLGALNLLDAGTMFKEIFQERMLAESRHFSRQANITHFRSYPLSTGVRVQILIIHANYL